MEAPLAHCRLKIRGYHTWVHLGCSEAERSMTQEVEFDVEIGFTTPPLGARTDRLEDTLNYGALCEALEATARRQPYQLIEALARSTYDALKKIAGPGPLIEVTVHKLRPPIENLRGGVRFSYGDILP